MKLARAADPAHADDRQCSGTIRAASIDGSVIVPSGSTCTLIGTSTNVAASGYVASTGLAPFSM